MEGGPENGPARLRRFSFEISLCWKQLIFVRFPAKRAAGMDGNPFCFTPFTPVSTATAKRNPQPLPQKKVKTCAKRVIFPSK